MITMVYMGIINRMLDEIINADNISMEVITTMEVMIKII